MYSPQDQLTELVRYLEDKGHIFSADPLLITEKLKEEPYSITQKLHYRAKRIDVDGKLTQTLTTIDNRVKGVIGALTIMWFILGFVGLFGVMQAEIVNFFYVLLFLLGFNTLMLLLWLFWLVFSSRKKPSLFASFISPSTLIRDKDPVTLAAIQLYKDQLHDVGFRWYISRMSHQFWLASLLGMLCSLILLLLVKNYHFVWESTLLQKATVVDIVNTLAWLPNFIGFPTPTAENIITSQMYPEQSFPIISFRWAMLLISSLLIYGVIPRLSVWIFCSIMVNRRQMTLNLKLPYYQQLIDFWQRNIVDPDDSPIEEKPTAPTAKISQAEKLVTLLEYPHTDENWYKPIVGQDAENFGMIDEREDVEKLLTYLQLHPVQVLVGISLQALPDRGTMRKLDKIAQYAQGGLIVKLFTATSNSLLSEQEQMIMQNRQQQWETALAERNIGLVKN